MRTRDTIELLTLAALWGASFLFMRMGASDFGAVALAAVRVAVASAVLIPILLAQGLMPSLRRHWKPIFIVGVVNSALPFLGFAYAALSITAGLSSIFNAAAPLFGALVAWIWLHERLTGARTLGLVIGFAGVSFLAFSNVNQEASFKPGGSGWAVVACLAAAALYGLSANFTKRYLAGVPPLAVATGSQVSATCFLVLPAIVWWPHATPSTPAWIAVLLLGLLCTGFAYILYFRLIANAGPANAIAVTYLLPAFAALWGWLFLAERITLTMLLGCAIILLGTALATGMLKLPERRLA
jgi:drug/metabolite transporter (DMT)-like permease